jgi:Predicted membrane protein (DUF2243)
MCHVHSHRAPLPSGRHACLHDLPGAQERSHREAYALVSITIVSGTSMRYARGLTKSVRPRNLVKASLPQKGFRYEGRTPKPSSHRGSILIGIDMGGFVDGIVLHQIAQWHNTLLSHAQFLEKMREWIEKGAACPA